MVVESLFIEVAAIIAYTEDRGVSGDKLCGILSVFVYNFLVPLGNTMQKMVVNALRTQDARGFFRDRCLQRVGATGNNPVRRLVVHYCRHFPALSNVIITRVDDASLLISLRAGDEAAFDSLVQQYHSSLVRLARLFVRDELIAEELAQETWFAVLQGLDRFEGRSSFKTWLFTILTNKAKTRGQRDGRSIAFSDLDSASHLPTVDPARFVSDSADAWENHWVEYPASWEGRPEEKLLAEETQRILRSAIDDLPESQRAVITLRDIHEVSSQETCNILGISETNQRVLLHRARAKARQALEEYLQTENG